MPVEKPIHDEKYLENLQALRNLLKTDEQEIAKKNTRLLDRIRDASERARERLKNPTPEK
jgi:hypothetical protein